MATFTASGSILSGVSALSATVCHRHSVSLPRPTVLPLFNPSKTSTFSLNLNSPKKPSFLKPLCSSSNPSFFTPPNPDSPPIKPPFLFNDNNTTLAALFALSLYLSSKIAQIITDSLLGLRSFLLTPTPEQLVNIQFIQDNVLCTAGPLFFAARSRPPVYLNTPLTVVAAGMAKWLDIYSGVLMVRVLLSWFPNIPWDRQPLSAIRDLCDPYLNLFRNIIPPIFDTLDISPLFAFAVLGTLGSILTSARGGK